MGTGTATVYPPGWKVVWGLCSVCHAVQPFVGVELLLVIFVYGLSLFGIHFLSKGSRGRPRYQLLQIPARHMGLALTECVLEGAVWRERALGHLPLTS